MSEIETDVLVLGGGPAGAWAAVSAAATGARVVLVDKGRCGTSGPTAFGTTSLWNIPPGPARDEAVAHAYAHGGGLGDPDWMHRVLEETHLRVEQLVRWGYRFPGEGRDPGGRGLTPVPDRRTSLRVCVDGASYLRRMRRSVLDAGVRILDHHPALQLLVDRDGVAAGATGVQQHNRFRGWTVRAGAVVVATGGCAFLSGGAGTDVDTGDGLLLAAEAGAQLSGMEFSSAYGLEPVLNSTFVSGLALHFATRIRCGHHRSSRRGVRGDRRRPRRIRRTRRRALRRALPTVAARRGGQDQAGPAACGAGGHGARDRWTPHRRDGLRDHGGRTLRCG
ncbi:FAD-dependent oxidoreductase [Nocardia sp. GCM10030253]|uniref:FAD-dependent oxidoreductase n=1 Tax=Nocardia sp. GCM10030253 TaxID=3273404 RepID=UPI00363C4B4E